MSNVPLTKQGIPDLNKVWPTKAKPRVPPPPSSPDIVDIHDLLYDDSKEIRDDILGRFPSARLEGSYDDIHESRISVYVRTTRLHWYRFLVQSGLAQISLTFQLSLRGGRDSEITLVEAAMDAERPGWRRQSK